jgi:hypothetical protein
MFDSLAHFGLTIEVLQALIIGGVLIVIIGTFWHYILAGCAVVFCLCVLCANVKPSYKIEQPVASVKPIVPSTPVETEKQRWHRQFMEDCTTVADNSTETCENIWNDRMMEESHLEVEPEAETQPVKFRKVRYD